MWAPSRVWEAYRVFDDDSVWVRYEKFTLDAKSFFLKLDATTFTIKGAGGADHSYSYDGLDHTFTFPNVDPNAQVTVNGNNAKHVVVKYDWVDGTPQHAEYATDRGVGDAGVTINYPNFKPFMDVTTNGTIVLLAKVQRSNVYTNRDFDADPGKTFTYTFVSTDNGVTWTRKDDLVGAAGGIVAWGAGKVYLYTLGGDVRLYGQAGWGPFMNQLAATDTIDVTVPGALVGDSVSIVSFSQPLNQQDPDAVSMSGTVAANDTVRVTINNAHLTGPGYPNQDIPAGTVRVEVVPAISAKQIWRRTFDPNAAPGSQWSDPALVYTGSGSGSIGSVLRVMVARSRDRSVAGVAWFEQIAATGQSRQRRFSFIDANGNLTGVEQIDTMIPRFTNDLRFGENNQPILLRSSLAPFSPYTEGEPGGHGSAAHSGYGFLYSRGRASNGWTPAEVELTSRLPLTTHEQFALITPGDTGTVGLPVVYGGGQRDGDGDYHSLLGPYILDVNDNYILDAPQTGGSRYPIAPVFVWRRQEGGVWTEENVDLSVGPIPIVLSTQVKTYKSHMMPRLVTESGYVCGAVWMARDGTDFGAHYTIWFVRRKL